MKGRPPMEPTDEQRRQVKAMAAYGIPHLDISAVLQIDAKTLRKHFWIELQTGAIEANAKVAQSLFKRATEAAGSSGTQAAIFWLRCRAGWKEIEAPAAPEPLGKKEEREMVAQHAERGTDWESLLN